MAQWPLPRGDAHRALGQRDRTGRPLPSDCWSTMPTRCRSNRFRGSGPINTTASCRWPDRPGGRHPSRHRFVRGRRLPSFTVVGDWSVCSASAAPSRHAVQDHDPERRRSRARSPPRSNRWAHGNGAHRLGRPSSLVDWWAWPGRLGVEFIAKPRRHRPDRCGADRDTGDSVVRELVVAALVRHWSAMWC